MPQIRGSAEVKKERGDEENGRREPSPGAPARPGDWGRAQTGDNAGAFSPGPPFQEEKSMMYIREYTK